MKNRMITVLTVLMLLVFSVPVAAESNSEIIYNYLTEEMSLNNAAACGVMGNIYQECTMNPDACGGNYYGICQWGGGRLSNLRSFCESNGYSSSSLDGQLRFLRHELENGYYDTLEYLQNVENTSEGAYNAAVYFCSHFEQPGNLSWENATRGNHAVDIFWPQFGI